RAGETVLNVAARLRHRDGSIRHVLLSANAQLERGQFLHARCVTRDVTELKHAESAMAYFKAMVESADDSIVGKTLDGVITTWNAAATRLYGYTAEEAIGQPITLLVPPDHREELTGIFESLRRDPDYRFGVLFFDCDRFKEVNDALGHAAGDRLLVEIAQRLRASVRPGDVVARLGGDEFTLLLEEVAGPSEVEHVARRVL